MVYSFLIRKTNLAVFIFPFPTETGKLEEQYHGHVSGFWFSRIRSSWPKGASPCGLMWMVTAGGQLPEPVFHSGSLVLSSLQYSLNAQRQNVVSWVSHSERQLGLVQLILAVVEWQEQQGHLGHLVTSWPADICAWHLAFIAPSPVFQPSTGVSPLNLPFALGILSDVVCNIDFYQQSPN